MVCCKPLHFDQQLTLHRFGAIILTSFTLPLILCYPNPVPSQGGSSQIVAWRRLAYMVSGAGEVAMGTMMLAQWLQVDSGLTDNALLGTTVLMGSFLLMRSYFLYVKPQYMEAQDNARKAK